jgi:exosome complex RNA-binding protein Rrp4
MSQPTPPILTALGDAFQFEMAVGANGRVWVAGQTASETVAIALAVQQGEGRSGEAAAQIVGALAKGAARRGGDIDG